MHLGWQFGVWMHLEMADCHVPFYGHCDLNLWPRSASSLVQNFYILWGRNSKLDESMHPGMAECHIPFLGHCDLDIWPSLENNLCPEHITYNIWARDPKFGVWLHLWMADRHVVNVFYTPIPHRPRIPRIDKYLDSWLNRTQFVMVLTDSHSL